jgi:hypothetical protein
MVGGYLAATIWKPQDVLNPFQLAVWGFFALLFFRAALQYLNQLSYDFMPEQAKTKRANARRIKAYIFCTAFGFASVCGLWLPTIW